MRCPSVAGAAAADDEVAASKALFEALKGSFEAK